MAAIMVKLLGTAFELVSLAAWVCGCLTLEKFYNTTCNGDNARLFGEYGIIFEISYDKSACEFLGNNIHPCWRITPRNQTRPNDPCQFKWSPTDSCNPESTSGCYMQENNTFYLRHVVDETLQEMMKLSGGRFEVAVKREANTFQPTVRYLLKRHEVLPVVFDAEVEKLTVNEEEISLNVTSYTLMLGLYYDLEYCVYHLTKGVVRVVLGGNVTKNRPNAPCVRVIFMARTAHNGSEVTLSFNEKGGCKRPGRATTIGLQVDMSTDMMVTESTIEPSSSSLPHIQCWSVAIGFILACSL